MIRRGFTVVELIITITIMGILLTLAVVGLNATQENARDDERVTDIESIQLNLESYFKSGSTPGTQAPTTTNLVPNPSVKTATTGWSTASAVGSSGVHTLETSDGPSGVVSTYFRRTLTAAATGSPLVIVSTPAGSAAVPVSPNTTYTFSAYVRTSLALSGGVKIDVSQFNAAETSTVITSGSYNNRPFIPNRWQRIFFVLTTDSTTVNVRVRYAFNGTAGAPIGTTFDVTGAMVTLGNTLYDYADGDTIGWLWSGTANASSSTGPSVATNTAATYPSIAVVDSALLQAYLPNADMKSFTAPGQSGPSATFVAATNAVQNIDGVLPQPTVNQYVYQPIDSNGLVCISKDCRKYNLYYRLEGDNTVYMVTGKNQ